MKSLCIENDFRMPQELRFFCEEHPELVGDVSTLSRALDYDPVDVAHRLSEYQTFVLSSTFIHKSQLEEMMEAFDKGMFGPGPFTFYVELLRQHLEEWLQREDDDPNEDYAYRARMNFSNHDAFVERLIRMSIEGRLRLFDVIVNQRSYDPDTEKFLDWREVDDYPNRELRPYRSEAIQMSYNSTTKQFERVRLSEDEQEIEDSPRLRDPNDRNPA